MPTLPHTPTAAQRDRLRDAYSKATLEQIAYLAWRWTKGDEAARARIAELLADLDRR